MLLLVSLIPTILIGVFSYQIGRTSLYERIQKDLNTQASHLMDQIDRFLFERHNDSQLLISDSNLVSSDLPASAKAHMLNQYLHNLGLYENIHLLDTEGKVIASTFSNIDTESFTHQPWIKQVRKNFYYTSNIHFSSATGKPTVLFANIMFDKENQPSGIIVMELLWPVVNEFLENVPAPAEAFLLNSADIEIGGGKNTDILKKSWGEEASNNFQNSEFLIASVVSRGYLVYRGNEWKLILQTPLDEALTPLNSLFTMIGLLLIVIIMGIILVGLILGSRFVAPIKRLTQGAQEIKQGNLNQKINIKSQDEFGFLALTFNQMARSLKQKQEKLEREIEREVQLKKVKDEIWTTASHNLRTPLTGINWILEMLSNGKLGKLNTKQQDAVEQLERNSTQLNYLVNLLLDASKMENEKIKLAKAQFFLEDIISGALERKKIEIKSKKLKIFTPDLKGKKHKLFLDPDKTQQVFNILIDNAVIYSIDGGSITIAVTKKRGKIYCDISDTGIGISAQDLKNIFDKFIKGENSETKNATGIGLGLYLAKIIVHSSGGKISATSSLGKGSKFTVELPLK